MTASAMRIGMLHFSCPPVVGGVESVLATHARLFLEAGDEVAAIVGRGARFHRGLSIQQIPIIDSRFAELERINAELRDGIVSSAFHGLVERIEQALRPVLRELDCCIVHNAFTLHFNLPLTAALHRLASDRCTQFVAWCHDLSWTNPLYLPLMRAGEPWSLLKSPAPHTRYVTVSEFRAAELRALFGAGAPVEPIPNGIDAAHFLGLGPATHRLLTQIDALEAFPFLLLPARITRRKNIELAIRVVAALRDRDLSPRLLVTGPPGPHNARSVDYVDELAQLIQELGVESEVVLLHRLARGDGTRWSASDAMIRELYRVADALIFPSAQEGFGLPVLEAGLARLPAFCADIQPFRDLAGPDLDYFLLDAPPAAIARQIEDRLQSSPQARHHRRVLREYDWAMIFAHQLRPMIVELVHRQGAAHA